MMMKPWLNITAQAPKMQPTTLPRPADDPTIAPEHYPGEGYRVTLFNDDFHTMDEVVGQVLKALGCTLDVAVHITLKAHSRGSATVIIAEQETAETVAGTLREIALVVSVERV